jgi:hypothetical protein
LPSVPIVSTNAVEGLAVSRPFLFLETSMFVASLTDAEVETLLLALKYWRCHRGESATRRGDRILTDAEVDVLLAKLGTGRLAMRPPDEDILTDLFSR